MVLSQNSNRISKKYSNQYSSNISQKNGHFPIILWGQNYSKPHTIHKNKKEIKLQTNFPHKHRCKLFNKMLAQRIQEHTKISYTMI